MDWNDLYERKETPWDKGLPTPVLAEIAGRHPDLFKGTVLVPGCGIGHDARWLAERGCKVVGADIAPLAVQKARALHLDAGLEFREVDLFQLPDDMRGAFDLVWEHTCLCALDPEMRLKYAEAIRETLKPGGTVAGVFFINPEMDPGETGPPFGIEVPELEALWQGVGFEVQDAWVPAVGYPGREGRERAMVLRRV